MARYLNQTPSYSLPTLALLGLLTLGLVGCGGSSNTDGSTSGSRSSNASSSSSDGSQDYQVTAMTADNGSISPTSTSVENGATTEFTLTPDRGYVIAGVTGCDGSLDGNTYTTGKITSDCTIETSFELTPPPAPELSLTAAAIKTFQFSWSDVDGESEYRLLEDPTGNSGYTQVASADADTNSHDLVVSLPKRINARYILQACNRGGCSDSDAVYVSGTLEQAVGYIKASNTGAEDIFGAAVALSGDGTTLAVGAPNEDSASTGVDSSPNDSANDAGAVYVFVRDGENWNQQAYLKASNSTRGDHFGFSVSLSGDGNTLAVGAADEDSSTTGVNSSPNNDVPNSGAAYVFTRTGKTWREEAYIKASTVSRNDNFGTTIALSKEGNTLAVGAPDKDLLPTEASTMRINGAGAVYIFSRSGETWSEQANIVASNADDYDRFGTAIAISEYGNTLAVGALREDSDTTGVGSTSNNDASNAGAVYVFTRRGDAWGEQAYIKASNAGQGDEFGNSVALSNDGHTLAVGAIGEQSTTTGVNSTPTDDSSYAYTGAAYVFTRSGEIWSEQAYIKASNAGPDHAYGYSIALSGDGHTLAVGSPGEYSSSIGVNSTQNDDATYAGAAYFYTRSDDIWIEQAYIKASNTEEEDLFGISVALSGDGNTLAVGAPEEDSSTTGVGGEPNESASDSGAVYLY